MNRCRKKLLELLWWNGVARISWNRSHHQIIPQHLSVHPSFVNRCFILESVSQGSSSSSCAMSLQLSLASLKQKKLVLPVYHGATLVVIRGVLWILGSSSHCVGFIPWATIIDNVENIFIAMACHWALLCTPGATLRYHLKRGSSVLQVKDQLKRLPRLQALFFLISQLAYQCRA